MWADCIGIFRFLAFQMGGVLGDVCRNGVLTETSNLFLWIYLEKRTSSSQMSALQVLLYLGYKN